MTCNYGGICISLFKHFKFTNFTRRRSSRRSARHGLGAEVLAGKDGRRDEAPFVNVIGGAPGRELQVATMS